MIKGVTIRTENGDEAAAVYSIKRSGDKLIMDGRALGTMHMDMILTAEDAIQAFRMILSWEVISFILLLPFYAIRNRMAAARKDHPEGD
jgi:UDP-2,3-diacylglucosamine pyrophosphatase LpxH